MNQKILISFVTTVVEEKTIRICYDYFSDLPIF
jgi:hypothetical protein